MSLWCNLPEAFESAPGISFHGTQIYGDNDDGCFAASPYHAFESHSLRQRHVQGIEVTYIFYCHRIVP